MLPDLERQSKLNSQTNKDSECFTVSNSATPKRSATDNFHNLAIIVWQKRYLFSSELY